MGIRISHEPVAAPIIASHATGVGLARERERKRSIEAFKYLDEKMLKTQMFWAAEDNRDARNKEAIKARKKIAKAAREARDKRNEDAIAGRADAASAADRRRFDAARIKGLRDIPRHLSEEEKKELRKKRKAITDMYGLPDYDLSDPDTRDKWEATIEDFNSLLDTYKANNENSNLRHRTADGELHTAPVPGGIPGRLQPDDSFLPDENPLGAQAAQAAKKADAAKEAQAAKDLEDAKKYKAEQASDLTDAQALDHIIKERERWERVQAERDAAIANQQAADEAAGAPAPAPAAPPVPPAPAAPPVPPTAAPQGREVDYAALNTFYGDQTQESFDALPRRLQKVVNSDAAAAKEMMEATTDEEADAAYEKLSEYAKQKMRGEQEQEEERYAGKPQEYVLAAKALEKLREQYPDGNLPPEELSRVQALKEVLRKYESQQ